MTEIIFRKNLPFAKILTDFENVGDPLHTKSFYPQTTRVPALYTGILLNPIKHGGRQAGRIVMVVAIIIAVCTLFNMEGEELSDLCCSQDKLVLMVSV